MHVNLLFKKIAALIPCLLLTVALNAQTVTKAFRSVPLKTVLEEVERQTGYSILFENEDVDVSRPVTATFKDATLQTVLDTVLDKSLRYTVKGGGKLVTISRRSPVSAPTAPNGEMTVAGTVISSADNQPIVGANIYVEGTNVGTTTDAGGNYKLTVPASAKTVTVSFLGYDTKKISVRDIHLFKLITLADASNKLEDVVVVGFGVQKKESLVGAVQSVKPSDLQTSSSNLSTSFSGKIAGVIAVQKSGEPGADGANFWIRGISTFGSGQSPLLILDGVEITDANWDTFHSFRPTFLSAPSSLHPKLEAMSAADAYEWVVQHVGASLPRRDRVDAFMIDELTSLGTKGTILRDTRNTTQYPIADTWQQLDTANNVKDTDGDGMPDEWEDKWGLNKQDASDAVKVASNGFTNIENYCFSLEYPDKYVR